VPIVGVSVIIFFGVACWAERTTRRDQIPRASQRTSESSFGFKLREDGR
jgi:hypothetical protein